MTAPGQQSSRRYADRRVVITGAASGIGRATAVRLVAEGARVFGIDRNRAGLAETRGLVSDADRFSTHEADLTQESEVVAAADAARSALGGIDVLVSVAGVLRSTPLDTLDLAKVQGLLAINLLAPMLMCRELAPYLPDGSGAVVLVTSTAATQAHPGMTGYAASQGGQLAFAISLAAELAPRRIRVVPVSPGGVDTPMMADPAAFEGIDLTFYGGMQPLWGGTGKAEDVAAAIAFAGSADAAYLTGTELRVDGGAHV